MNVNDNIVKTIARAIVTTINDATKRERALCAELKLSCMFLLEISGFNDVVVAIVDAHKLATDKSVLSYKHAADKDGFVPKFNENQANERFATYQVGLTLLFLCEDW